MFCHSGQKMFYSQLYFRLFEKSSFKWHNLLIKCRNFYLNIYHNDLKSTSNFKKNQMCVLFKNALVKLTLLLVSDSILVQVYKDFSKYTVEKMTWD